MIDVSSYLAIADLLKHNASSIKRERMIVIQVTYFMFRRKANAPEVGEYITFDIAAYGCLWNDPLVILRDVALDEALVFRMVQTFNRCRLSPLHLKDAVLDMLE